MGQLIEITAGSVSVTAELNDSETARRIYAALPLNAKASTWGDEIYFSIPVDCPAEDARQEVEVGDLGYWLAGSGFCIFFGRTPMSSGDEPVAASPVNVFGRVQGDATVLTAVQGGEAVTIAAAT